MSIVSNIKELVPENINSSLIIEENFSNFKAKLTIDELVNFDKELILKILNTVSNADTLFTFNIKFDESEEISLESNDVDTFIGNINDYTMILHPNITMLNIVISKNIYSDSITIYSLENFADYLIGVDPSTLIEILSQKYRDNFITFTIKSLNTFNTLSSSSFVFKNDSEYIPSTFIVDNQIYDNFNRECTHIRKYNHMFTPYDFNLDLSIISPVLNKAFKKLRNLFSLIYLFNISDLNNNLILKINGYKNMSITVNLCDLYNDKLDVYFDIFTWVYTDGNIVDKLNIARNILSLYLTDHRTILVDLSVLSAIKSNHSLYLKNNVENYLDIKSKVIDNIIATNSQISELINELTGNFIKNLSAIGTFIISITIVNSINNGNLSDIFTKDITIISLFLSLVSVFYLKYTINEYTTNKARIKTIYERLKLNYKDILFERDVDDLFKNDEYYNHDIKVAEDKYKFYYNLWCYFLLSFEILVILLGVIPLCKI